MGKYYDDTLDDLGQIQAATEEKLRPPYRCSCDDKRHYTPPKMTAKKVRRARLEHSRGESTWNLAIKYHIDPSQMSRILRRLAWRNVR